VEWLRRRRIQRIGDHHAICPPAEGLRLRRVAMLEKARDAAVAAVVDPGRIALSGETVTMGGRRLMLLAMQAARLICGATGVTDDIEHEVHQRIVAEPESNANHPPARPPTANGWATYCWAPLEARTRTDRGSGFLAARST
jgi:hypothetical protein